jgi:hypothetical protein
VCRVGGRRQCSLRQHGHDASDADLEWLIRPEGRQAPRSPSRNGSRSAFFLCREGRHSSREVKKAVLSPSSAALWALQAAGRSPPGARGAVEAAMGAARANRQRSPWRPSALHRIGQRLHRFDQDADVERQGQVCRIREGPREGARLSHLRRCHRLYVARDYAESLAGSRGFPGPLWLRRSA